MRASGLTEEAQRLRRAGVTAAWRALRGAAGMTDRSSSLERMLGVVGEVIELAAAGDPACRA